MSNVWLQDSQKSETTNSAPCKSTVGLTEPQKPAAEFSFTSPQLDPVTCTSKQHSSDTQRCRQQETSPSWEKSELLGNVMFHPRGTRWQCQRCAMCCADAPRHSRNIRLLPSESTTISKVTGMKLDEFSTATTGSSVYDREMLKEDGRCFFLNGKSCTIYDDRPLTCIFYPFFLYQNSLNHIEFCMTTESCPGLGVGRTLDRDYYETLLCLAIRRFKCNRSPKTVP